MANQNFKMTSILMSNCKKYEKKRIRTIFRKIKIYETN